MSLKTDLADVLAPPDILLIVFGFTAVGALLYVVLATLVHASLA